MELGDHYVWKSSRRLHCSANHSQTTIKEKNKDYTVIIGEDLIVGCKYSRKPPRPLPACKHGDIAFLFAVMHVLKD